MEETASVTRAPASTLRRAPMTEKLERTTQGVATAYEAYLLGAIESVHWERRGPLQRLVRSDRTAAFTPPAEARS